MLDGTRRVPDRDPIGDSDIIAAVKSDVYRIARSDAKVLITGETGVGKEVFARLIHQRSARASAALVTINCAGLPDELLESELFGHVRGSFTGAYRDKTGLVDLAANGTLFLDEVGEMSARMQAVLLRFVESGEVQRVGADRVHRTGNVRIIAATNRDLEARCTSGHFREDLYFRLSVVTIGVPPLRARVDDIPLLVHHFLAVYARANQSGSLGMSAAAMTALGAYPWPGNVRELKNVIERIVVRTTAPMIEVDDIPAEILRSAGSPAAALATGGLPPGVVPVSEAQSLVTAMRDSSTSFWSAVHPQFMSRDLTRVDLRHLVRLGLTHTNGDYRELVEFFNMPTGDYSRFMRFLRTHDCYLPFRAFPIMPDASRC